MKHDELADMLNIIKYTESIGRLECIVPASGLIEATLNVIKKDGYIKGFEKAKDKANKFIVHLHGRINDCNVVRPRFSITKDDFIRWEKKFLPASGVGTLILTTPKGVMDQRDAIKNGTGGKLLGYIY